MDLILRFSLHTKPLTKVHVESRMPCFAQAMQLLWRSTKASTEPLRLSKFYNLYKDRLTTIFPADQLEAVMTHLENPRARKAQLLHISQMNELGKSLWGETVQVMLSHEISAAVVEGLQAHVHGVNIDSQQTHDELVRKVLAHASAADKDNVCRDRRTVSIDYRGIPVPFRK